MVREKVSYRAKLNWFVLFLPAIFLFIVIIGFASASGAVGWLFIFLAALAGFFWFENYYSSEFDATNKLVLVKVGFICKHFIVTLLTKVEGIIVNHELLSKIFGYKTIAVN